MLTGIAPALQATRPDPVGAMKEESAGAGARRSTLREGLIVVQVALSVVLLGGSGLLVRSFFMLHRGPGFDPDAVVLVRLRPSLVGYTNDRAWAFQREVIRRLEAMPGDRRRESGERAAAARMEQAESTDAARRGFRRSATRRFRRRRPSWVPRYFKTLGVGVVEGREFDDRDTPAGPRVVLVNETLARHFWPNGGAVGSTRDDRSGPLRSGRRGEGPAVGQRPGDSRSPIAYLNFWQQDRSNSWSQDSRTHIRVSGDAAAMLPEIRRAIAAIDPDVPIADAQSLGASVDYHLRRRARGADDARDVWRAGAGAEHDRAVCGARVCGRAADA